MSSWKERKLRQSNQKNQNRTQRTRSWLFWYDAALAAGAAVLAAVLIVQVITVYRTGTSAANLSADGVYLHPIFSRETAAAYLLPLAPWALVWFLAALAGIGIHAADKQRPLLASEPEEETQKRLEKRLAAYEEAAAVFQLIADEKKKQKLADRICATVCLVCAACAGWYLCNPAHFTSWDLETVMGQMLAAVLPWLVLAFGALSVRAIWVKKSLRRMIEAEKAWMRRPLQESSGAAKAKMVSGAEAKDDGHRLAAVRIVIVVLAVLFLILGVGNGGMRDVLVKAINICTECIGLG